MAKQKLPLNQVLAAIDKKDRGFYDRLSDDDKKQLAPFLLNRYASSVSGDPMLVEYFLLSDNTKVNRNFFDFSKHPKLQWLRLTTVSPGLGTCRHEWIPMSKTTVPKSEKFLAEIFPAMKDDEIKLLSSVNSTEDLIALGVEHGMDPKEVKKKLK
jgi:hypothetical protein